MRDTVRTAVIDAWRASPGLAGVQVERVWPGDETAGEFIIFGDTEGTVEVPVFRGPPSNAVPLVRDDKYGIRVYVRAANGGQSEDDAEDRVATMYYAAEETLAGNPGLSKLPGLIAATVTDSLGPVVARTKLGLVGMWNFTINVHERAQ